MEVLITYATRRKALLTVLVGMEDSGHGNVGSSESVVIVSKLERGKQRSTIVSERYVVVEFTSVHHDRRIEKLGLDKRQCWCYLACRFPTIVSSLGFIQTLQKVARQNLAACVTLLTTGNDVKSKLICCSYGGGLHLLFNKKEISLCEGSFFEAKNLVLMASFGSRTGLRDLNTTRETIHWQFLTHKTWNS